MSPTAIPREREKSLRKLAEMMNTRHHNPFPITKPLLDCFDVAITPEENDFLIRLGTEPFTYQDAALLSDLDENQFRSFFEGLKHKGVIWPKSSPDKRELFALSGILMGWFEVYLCDGEETPEKQEFARRVDALIKSWKKYNTFPIRNLINYRARRSNPQQRILPRGSEDETVKRRKIAVGQAVPIEPTKIYPAKTIHELLEKHGDNNSIAVVHCFCRQYRKMINEPCRFEHPAESCLTLGEISGFAVRAGVGRHISKSEAVALIRELSAKGAIHQVFHEGEDLEKPEIAICNCCWDCCAALASYNRGIVPLNLKSYFEARLSDASSCNGCGTCVQYCPVHAISLVNEKCNIDSRKCIGCGQCELQCPEDAVRMIPHERNVILPLENRSEARIR